jgi:hypothetical protein
MRIKETYSLPEIIEMVRDAENKTPKRTRGRPKIADKFTVLDAAAVAKVRYGRYTQIAGDWKLTANQLVNLVGNNSKYFAARVEALRKNTTD